MLPLLKRPEEQRLAIGVVSGAPTAGALELLLALAVKSATANDAYSAVLKLAEDKASPIPKEQRRHALQRVAEKSNEAATRYKANEILSAMR